MNPHQYLFGYEIHELCRQCPGAVWNLFWFRRLAWTAVSHCPKCNGHNAYFTPEFARRHYSR